jgi:hypothetical protein
VGHDQAKRSYANLFGIRNTPTGSKRAAIRVAWSACWDLPRLAAMYGGSHTGSANISRLARGGRLAGRRDAGTPGTAIGPRRPRVRSTRNRTPSPAARRPEAATAAWRAAPSVHRLSVRSGIASGRVRRLDRQHDRCHRTSLNGAAGRWGHFGGGLVSSPSKGGDDGRGWRPGTGGVGESRQRHSQRRGHRRRWPADHCALGRRFAVGVCPKCGVPAGHRP